LLLILIVTLGFFITNKVININVKLVKNVVYLLQKYGVVPREGLNFKVVEILSSWPLFFFFYLVGLYF
jgi:hypothetical protein